MLVILVQWILHKIQNHLSQLSPRSTTRPLYFWCFVSNSAFFKSQRSISEAKWTFAPVVLASSITSFLLLTFVRSHAGIFSSFSHSSSTAAFAEGIFMAWGIGINLCTKLWWWRELSPFPAIWSSWHYGRGSPVRILVDSLASKIRASFEFDLQCIAGAIWCFQFSSCVLNDFLELPCPQGQWNRFLVIYLHYRA